MIRYFFYVFGISLLFSSCEKDINIQLNPSTTDLVVDGSIENDKYPVVVLSRSLEYFNTIDPATLAKHFVHGAQLKITNDTVTAYLKEDSVINDSSGLVVYFYTFKPSDTTTKIKGQFNTKYTLTIDVEGKTYTAVTSITSMRKTIDSLWTTPAPSAADSQLVNVKARVTDPKGLGDFTRYYTSVNKGPYFPGLNSVFDDQITDGTTYTVTVDQGVDRNNPINIEDYSFFHKGDIVVVKLANIDKGTYDFWRTMEYNYQSVGNPFSTPTRVISNVSNGALGYFGGYAAQYVQVFVQP